MNVILLEVIQETPTYQNLIKKNNFIQMKLLQKRDVREKITNSLNVYKHSGEIPSFVTGTSLMIVKDLIEMGM